MSAIPTIQRDRALPRREPSPSDLLLRDVLLPVTIRPAQPLSDKDMLAFCVANEGLEIESDAEGNITIMTPAGPESSRLNQLLTAELTLWSRQEGRQAGGVVFGPDLGIRFPDRTMRGPDAAWLSAERWSGLSAEERETFLTFCPEFVAELRSASDRASASEAKMEFWMARGALIGWFIDPKRKLAMIYHPGREPEILLQPEFLDGDGPISGFRLEMRQFWK